MWYYVFSSNGFLSYEGYSWPMARAALDAAILQDNGCPMLNILPEEPRQKLIACNVHRDVTL